MKPEHQHLWQQIEAFDFDATDTRLSFGQRLARDNGWSAAFTRSVLLEYRRYVFLAMTAGHPVCPSDAVDQAWHLHLTYTRNYWDDFCGRILGRPLHHGPTRGGRDEDVKHHEMYAKTLAAYRDAFGEDAPAEVWHPAEVRFGEDVAFSRVNTRRNWVIAKPRWMRKAALAAAVVLAVSATGCFSPMASASVMEMAGGDFLAFFPLFSIGVFCVAAVLRSRSRTQAAPLLTDDSGKDVYAIATLSGGGMAAVNTAMIGLARHGLVEVRADGRVCKSPAAEGADSLHPFERAVYDAVKPGVCDLREIREGVRSWVDGMIAHLRTIGLVMSEQSIAKSQSRVLAVLMLVPLVGVLKVAVGLSRDRPVFFLVLMLIVAVIAMVVFMKRRPFRTKRGDALLSELRQNQPMPTMQERTDLVDTGFGSGSLAMCAALYGTSVLAGTEMNHLNKALTPPGSQNGSSGCSSTGCGGGCGSSGSGGGDGGGGSSGCGGCGGGGGGD